MGKTVWETSRRPNSLPHPSSNNHQPNHPSPSTTITQHIHHSSPIASIHPPPPPSFIQPTHLSRKPLTHSMLLLIVKLRNYEL
ncbi:hypothetical protein E2C01_100055 [Portunus trituberculatus]|uniref:Uncharacterized protein n=1 Tax=Portunus trituberculatus TaxID=210409 RepID=A0A5B7K5Q5_PORTR|nr:hypothetical protein [Portunus trituberculatus]